MHGVNRHLRIGALTLAAAIAPAVALAAPAAPQTRVTSDCQHERYKPKKIIITCADGTEVLQALHWTSWHASKAGGRGTDYVVSCNPDCAAGKRTAYPVTVTLSRPQTCTGHRYPVFTRAVLRFGAARPHKRTTETDQLSCPF